MNTINKPPTRFGLETYNDFYEKLKWESKRLEDGWGIYDTFNFIVTAHHLYVDWIDRCGNSTVKVRKSRFPVSAKLVMQCVADLANGNKHWQMNRPNSVERQVVKNVDKPMIGDYYSYFIAGPMIYVDFDNYSLSMSELMDLLLGYFKWIFEDEDISFPLELENQLDSRKLSK